MPCNIKLTLEYDGTDYVGWQTQPNGPTIQETLERTLDRILGHPVTVYGSGRTDSGVHALGQVANVRTGSAMPLDELKRALNAVLPEDIAVREIEEVGDSFHARKSAVRKTYRYRLHVGEDKPVIGRRYVARCRYALDEGLIREAASLLEGRHDFGSFCSEYDAAKDTRRTVERMQVAREDDVLTFTVTAGGFLYNMVRAIVGTLIEVGRGRMTPRDVERLLERPDRSAAGPTAPPEGLFLVSVEYE